MRAEQPLDEPLLADFLVELRSWGTGPAPVPTTALAALIDNADVVHPAPQPIRRKKMLVTKLAGLGLAAKLGLGLGVATAAVTTAGATGVLPDAAQHGVATVVNAVSPLQLPDPSAKVISSTGTDLTEPGPGADDPAGDTDAGDGPDNHGACVSAVAQDKTVTGRDHGKVVSAVAKSDCGKGDATTTSTSTSSTSTTTTSTTTTTVGTNAAGTNRGPGANSGNGNGGNSGNAGGNGNAGNGGNGNGNSGSGGANGGSSSGSGSGGK